MQEMGGGGRSDGAQRPVLCDKEPKRWVLAVHWRLARTKPTSIFIKLAKPEVQCPYSWIK